MHDLVVGQVDQAMQRARRYEHPRQHDLQRRDLIRRGEREVVPGFWVTLFEKVRG